MKPPSAISGCDCARPRQERILALPRFFPSPPPREERAGVRRHPCFDLKSPLPNPLPVWAGRGSRGHCQAASPRQTTRGFTLPEVLITMTLFLFVLGGVIFAHLFGLRLFQMTNTKLRVTQWARLTTESLADQIHGSYSVQVGNKTTGGFVGFLPGEVNEGTSLLIQPTENPTNYVVYFLNVADQTFQRMDQSGNVAILADSITNQLAFSAQNFSGNLLTNRQNNQVIHLTLEFYHPPTFMERADYFKLETSIKQRVVPQ